eukprot:TRINITY_DN3429_c0_g1_i5.p1 TRINITY_DN3429_c0_g1~~TRINITY_DN3429_c0_g1_i5.p1  ORF type:complete len:582 (-),score=97.49 TRINITY_DN3429_c0_g1_i5:196-1686(-)
MDLTDALTPSYASMAKNSQGAVDSTSAGYLVNRYLANEHGWQLKGLVTGRGFDFMSPVGHMGARIPSNIKQLFETRVNSTGLQLDELGILIATLEDVVNDEMVARLRAVASARNINLQKKLMKHRAQELLHYFAASWVAGTHLGELTKERLELDLKVATETFHRWPRILTVIEESKTLQTGAVISASGLESDAKRMMKSIHDLALNTCSSMMNKLIAKSTAGRLRLGDFYAASDLESGFEFGESAKWLRTIGSLDETDPEDPKVMVANYVQGPSNCMTSSDYYSVCCHNPCDIPLTVFEQAVNGSHATPVQLEEILLKNAQIKEGFRINNFKFTRANLELDKLQKIADVNGGVVPLHGRLFHQYLHHLFPTYCTFPQPPDVAAARTFDGSPPVLFASSEEKDKYIKVTNAATKSTESQQQSKISSNDKVKVDGHWNEEEHLFSPKVSKTGDRHDAGMHTIMLFGAVGFFGWGIARMATESHDSLHAFYGKSNVKLI